MFLFLMSLLVMLIENALPREAGGPQDKPPDLDDAETALDYATAYYWDMYGETSAQHNRVLTKLCKVFGGFAHD